LLKIGRYQLGNHKMMPLNKYFLHLHLVRNVDIPSQNSFVKKSRMLFGNDKVN